MRNSASHMQMHLPRLPLHFIFITVSDFELYSTIDTHKQKHWKHTYCMTFALIVTLQTVNICALHLKFFVVDTLP